MDGYVSFQDVEGLGFPDDLDVEVENEDEKKKKGWLKLNWFGSGKSVSGGTSEAGSR